MTTLQPIGGSNMPSGKKRPDPWWYTPTIFDVVAIAKVYRHLPYLLIQRILRELAKTLYPTRPRNAKDMWIEPVTLDGALFQLSCRIDEKNRKIVVTNIRPPKKMMRTFRHK
jgi:hypothetical protein